MMVGDPRSFAIEFEITEPYPDDHFLALGFFIVHVNGHEYGIREPDATTFGNAVDAANELLQTRGKTPISRLAYLPAHDLADEYLAAFYRDAPRIFSESVRDERMEEFLSANCLWPNQDEEFDDGSHILRFDTGGQVRIVAFRNDDYFPGNLAEIAVESDRFYDLISRWIGLFHDQRQQALQRQ